MADKKTKLRASKLLELTGKPSYDPTTDSYINRQDFLQLSEVLKGVVEREGRIDDTRLSRTGLENSLTQWESIPPIIRSLMGVVIRNKLKSTFLPYSTEGVDKLIPAINEHLLNPGIGDDTRLFFSGINERLPQVPERVPELIDQIRQPADIDKLSDLTDFLLKNRKLKSK